MRSGGVGVVGDGAAVTVGGRAVAVADGRAVVAGGAGVGTAGTVAVAGSALGNGRMMVAGVAVAGGAVGHGVGVASGLHDARRQVTRASRQVRKLYIVLLCRQQAEGSDPARGG